MTLHRLPIKVYLEDTDAQGIVYHANYLKYCERARTDILEEQGFRLHELQAEGCTLVVYEMTLRFRRPAHLHERLEVRTRPERTSDYRTSFQQEIFRGDETDPLFVARADVVAVDEKGALRMLPEGLLKEA